MSGAVALSLQFRLFNETFTIQCASTHELREKLHASMPGVPTRCIWDDMELPLDDPAMLEFLLEECSRKNDSQEIPLQVQIRIGQDGPGRSLVECFVGSFEEILSAADKIVSRDEYSYDIVLNDVLLTGDDSLGRSMFLQGNRVVMLKNIRESVEEEKERDALHSELRQWLRSTLNSLPNVRNDLLSSLCAAFAKEGITTVALLRSVAANGRSEVLDLCSDIAGEASVRKRGFRRGHKTRLVEAILALAHNDPSQPGAPVNEVVEEGVLERACDDLKMADTQSHPGEAHGINVSLVALPEREGEINLPNSANISVQIEVPETMTQLGADEVVGTDVVCVVDVSGSMSDIAAAGPDGEKNKDGLSILDLVKHSLKAVINQLDGNDRLAVVSFSTTAKRVFELTSMTATGREQALAALESMQPHASTNIWAGLLEGMETIRDCDDGLGTKVLVAGIPGLVEKTVVARRKTVMLLTDGMPNCEPPKGHLAELRTYLDAHPDFHFQLNTFGFGYGLNSNLLSELATEGGGTFAFIPDALIVGTVFVNTMANALSAFSQTATLSLIPKNGAKVAGLPGFKNACALLSDCIQEGDRASNTVAEESWGLRVNLGPLQMGQAREITVPLHELRLAGEMPEASVLEVVLKFPDPVPHRRGMNLDGAPIVCSMVADISAIEVAEACGSGRIQLSSWTSPGMDVRKAAAIGVLRNEMVQTLAGAIEKTVRNDGESALADMDMMGRNLESRFHQLVGLAARGEDESDPRLEALQADVNGRATKALQGMDRFKRWGKHYLLAIARAHELRQCTNFMDPGLQVYGGESFKNLRTKGDEMFLALPPPVRSKGRRYQSYSGSGAPARSSPASQASTAYKPPPAPAVNMSTYYSGAQGGCFGGNSTVIRVGINGHQETVQVKSIRAGDRVRVADGSAALVRCVVAIERAAGKQLVEFVGGGTDEFLAITPKHPVYVGERWCLPSDVVDSTDKAAVRMQVSDHIVFNLLLEKGKHSVLVGGVACATWGHGLTGSVIEHPLFGDYDRVLELLTTCVGWERGLVCLEIGGLMALYKKQGGNDICQRRLTSVKAVYAY